MAIADLVIVGAGTAGCVLAARLSADPSRTVVLLEAGRDFSDRSSMPAALTTGNGEGFDWGLSALVTAGRPAPSPKGKVVGGSAQVNGKGAVRALPADYDAWAAKALPAWSWHNILPAYCRAETDNDFPDSADHGAHGPVPIMRPNRNRLTPPMAGFLDAALAHGHPYHDDMNAPGAVGIGPYPHNHRRFLDRAKCAHCVFIRIRHSARSTSSNSAAGIPRSAGARRARLCDQCGQLRQPLI